MASIPNNGYAAVMAGTNVYTGSNFYGSDCPKTPIVPTDPDDLCNRAFVLGAIPPPPPTPPVTEFSYTNTSNAVVPVVAPTASGQKLNLLASGLNLGSWSTLAIANPFLSPQGVTAFFIDQIGGFWVATQQIGAFSVAILHHFSADMTTYLGGASFRFQILPFGDPIINSIAVYAGKIVVGGKFDTVSALDGTGSITTYNFALFLPAGYATIQMVPTLCGDTTNNIFGVNGEVTTVTAYGYGFGGNNAIFLGGQFNSTLPNNIAGSTQNLIIIDGFDNNPAAVTFRNDMKVQGGSVSAILPDSNGAADGIIVGGSFTTVGVSAISQPYFTKLNVYTGATYPQLIPTLNGPITGMCYCYRNPIYYNGVIPDVLLLSGNFNLTSSGGSDLTAYFRFTSNTVYPAVINPPAGSTGGKVYSGPRPNAYNDVKDAVLFGGSNIVMTNNSGTGNYWASLGVNGGTGTAIAICSTNDIIPVPSPNFWTANRFDNFIRKYTAGVGAPVATFQLPTARFRSATAPSNIYQNAVFSTAAGAQVFLSGADLNWSPAGALTTGLTFT
jgi:hypothetical protein